jgi:hypothetical protein
MASLKSVLSDVLHEIHDAPNLKSESRIRVEKWLVLEDQWTFVKNFGELVEIAEEAGITTSQLMMKLAFELDTKPVPQVQARFFREVPLPPGLNNKHLQMAMDWTQRVISRINRSLCFGTGFPLISFIQANNFSGIVSNVLTDSLDKVSSYKHNHDQRFPDLRNRSNDVGLEMKASNKPARVGRATMDMADGI